MCHTSPPITSLFQHTFMSEFYTVYVILYMMILDQGTFKHQGAGK